MIDLSFMPKIIKILSKYPKYIKTSFLISNMHCQELYLGNFKSDLDFLAPLDSRFSNSCISAKYCRHIKPYINGKLIYSAFSLSINLT